MVIMKIKKQKKKLRYVCEQFKILPGMNETQKVKNLGYTEKEMFFLLILKFRI